MEHDLVDAVAVAVVRRELGLVTVGEQPVLTRLGRPGLVSQGDQVVHHV